MAFNKTSHYDYSQWQSERRLLSQWGRWAKSDNHSSIQYSCGLSYYGTPKTIMDKIWECGAIDEAEVTGYADPPVCSNYLMQEIERYMDAVMRYMPWVYRALIARHLRVVDGARMLISSERRMAVALYELPADRAHNRFRHDCDMGYAMLHLRLMNYSRHAS